jgi:hypothetical protein
MHSCTPRRVFTENEFDAKQLAALEALDKVNRFTRL